MRRNMPSLGALVAFESAARHESFTKAAHELALTQSAICRRIGTLEAHLGVPLFLRLARGVRLSEAGAAYARQVSARLDEIERDALELRAHRGQGVTIELAVMPTFATRWLIPRLASFYADHPHLRINLTTQTRAFLFEGSGFDAALNFGLAGWPGTQAHFLMHEDSYPVCSPALLGGRSALSAEEIATYPLIQQSTRPYAWRDWFDSGGLSLAHDMTGMRMELFSMSAQAAMLGTGIALIPPMLIGDELADGRLVVANPRPHRDDKAYHLIIPDHHRDNVPLLLFRTWLLRQCAETVQG